MATVSERSAIVVSATVYDQAKGVLFYDVGLKHEPTLRGWISEEMRRNPLLKFEGVDRTQLLELREEIEREDGSIERKGLTEDDLFRHKVRELICNAAEHNASDIRIRVREHDAVVYFHIDGEDRLKTSMSAVDGRRMLRAIYVGLAIGDSQYYDDRHQAANISGSKFPRTSEIMSIRVQKGPCFPLDKGGETMVLRLFYTKTGRVAGSKEVLKYPNRPPGKLQLAQLGYNELHIRKLKYLMDVPSGITFFTGPTGSGKSTTLAQVLSEIQRRTPDRNILTAEDPVEYEIPGATQLQIVNALSGEARENAYTEMVAAMLRMAPQVILLGEIRDAGVAKAALSLALTGHAVFSTVHVNNPFQWVERFEEMGLDRRSFCDFERVRGVVNQRLVARVCPDCSWRVQDRPESLRSEQGEEIAEVMEILQTWGDASEVRFRGNGCDRCSGRGTLGRFAVAEVIVSSSKLMSLLHDSVEKAREWYYGQADADKPLIEQGIDLALAGKVDPFTVKKRINAIHPKSSGHGVIEFMHLRQKNGG